MNCRECYERLGPYVDRELNDVELQEVKRHLADCPPCEDRFHLEEHLKRLVKVSCEQATAPEGLRTRLRQILF